MSTQTLLRNLFSIVLASLLVQAGRSQTLARPGWSGSGLTVAPWWTRAVTYEIDPARFASRRSGESSSLHAAIGKLDYVHSLGVDAVVLAHLQPATAVQDQSARLESVDPALGTLEDVDDFVREASRDNLRVIVALEPTPADTAAQLEHAARFWLTRGVAGISVGAVLPASQLHALHEVTRSFSGQRVLIAPSSAESSQRADLILDARLASGDTDAATLRSGLEKLQQMSAQAPVLALTDRAGLARSASRLGQGNPEAAKVLATLLLATRADAQLLYGQEIGLTGTDTLMSWGVPPDMAAKARASSLPEVAAEEADTGSLLNWYRRLIDLHHGSSALRSGTDTFLDHDAEHALVWVVRPPQVTPLSPAVVVACNLSEKPVTLSLTGDLASLHLRGAFLRTILRSGPGMGGMSLNAVTLPPFGVFLGELRF